MTQKLSWKQIEAEFNQQWVELVDFDWEKTESYPRSGRIRVHSSDRKEFDRLIKRDNPIDSAILFVGKRPQKVASFLSSNLHRVTEHETVHDRSSSGHSND